jgi:hypothetical protein
MMRAIVGLFLLFFILPSIAYAECFDVSKGKPDHLRGLLTARIFAGAPGFEDVQKGDTPEPGYVLKLAHPICLTGDADFADPAYSFDEVQLVPNDDTAAAMRSLKGGEVFVELEKPMPAMTGHHHRPLVAWVTSISPARTPTEGYGTAATTVEGFYLALAQGDGDAAAAFVVAEKTRKGPFSARALSHFYGNLREPLSLIDVEMKSPTQYLVRYHFVSRQGACDGHAIVHTEKRKGRNYISSIKALNGC